MASCVRPSVLAVLSLLALDAAPAFAGPNGAIVVGGSVTAVTGQGTATVTVTQSSNSAIINWNTFNIGAGEVTRFNQPNASSIVLNRVTGPGASEIYGTISANGRVFLINRDGILFGPGSTVDTAGFLATTHDINNGDFMAGRYVFGIPGRPDASIVNQGTITAHSYGFAALVAPGVRNEGIITANLGTVALVSGNGFTLDFYGDKLITLKVGDQIATQVRDVATGLPLSSLVTNTGKLKANGGRVELTAATARLVVDSVINNTGVIEANTFRRHGGTIVLSAGTGTGATKVARAPKQTIKLSGTLSASAKKKGKGGKIIVTAENIEVSGATINATGPAGGGTVLIGGDWSGGNPNASLVSNGSAHLEPYSVPTATTVTIDGASTINASATAQGNGGKVIVWADQLNTFAGTILARGGATGGDGGFVETSGHQQLVFSGNVDTRAPNGANGTLLLDPADTYIDASFITRPPGSTEILTATLISQLNNGNVVISTNNSTSPGGQNGDIFVTGLVTWSNSNSLTLNAFRNIEVSGVGSGATIINTGGGSLVMRADSTGTGAGTILLDASTFSNRIDWSASTGTVALYYNPAGGYASPTNFTTLNGHITTNPGVANQLTAYMLVNSDVNLQNVSTNLSGTYALGRDITSFTNVSNFAPIGSVSFSFTGLFEGLGHTISNINIAPTLSTTNNIGLFGYIGTGSVVRNFNITNASVTANNHLPPATPGQFVGILAGENAGTITNISVSGTINGGTLAGVIAGGLVGQNQQNGTITTSQSAANVTLGNAGSGSGQGNDAGGLVGNNEGAISNSSATGTIVGGASVFAGGLVGRNDNFSGSGPAASITNSNASGNVTVASGTVFSSSAGGLVGFNSATGFVSNSSATGNVTGGAFAILGGLVGQNEGAITQSTYSKGTVNGAGSGSLFDSVGGLVGFNSGTVTDSNVTSATVTGSTASVGGLVGNNSGTITGTAANLTFANATVTVSGDGSSAGGLVGQNNSGGSIQTVSATGSVAPSAAAMASDLLKLGGLVGQNSGTLKFATANVTVTGQLGSAGGLVGQNDGTITNSSAIGAVNGAAMSGYSLLGGLVGNNLFSGSISNSNASGNVAGGSFSYLGGLVGQNQGTIATSSAAGNVNGTGTSAAFDYIGGLVGSNFSTGQITSSTASGTVSTGGFSHIGGLIGDNSASLSNLSASNPVNASGPSVLMGGLIGSNNPGATITNSQASGSVTFTANGVSVFTTAIGGLVGENGGAINNSTATGAVSGTGGTSGNVLLGGFVGLNNPGASITNSSASGNVTGGASSYVGGLVGQNQATVATSNASGNVSGTGVAANFDYIGGLIGSNFSTGQITSSTATGTVSTGGFAHIGGLIGDNSASLSNLSASNPVNASGPSVLMGGLIGSNNPGATITNSQASGNVTFTANGVSVFTTAIGGLVGENGGAINNSTAMGAVSGTGGTSGNVLLGGFVGFNTFGASIANSTASGNVTGAPTYAGGLVGENGGAISASSATGAVSSTFVGGVIGGFVAANVSTGTVTSSHATGNVSGGSQAIIGGFVGGNEGSITASSAMGTVSGPGALTLGGFVGINAKGTISTSTAGGAVTGDATSTGVGGFVGINIATITDSSATGTVMGGGSVGGFVGFNLGVIDPSSATGAVTGGAGSIVGGFAGSNLGVITLSTASGNVSGGVGSLIGGFVGFNLGDGVPGDPFGIISHSHASGNVSGGDASLAGGFFGINLFGAIDHAYAVGAVTGGTGSTLGGFGGLNLGTVNVAFSTGAVTGGDSSFVGGFVGVNFSVAGLTSGLTTGAISDAYAVGAVTGGKNSYVAGFAAINVGSLDQTLAIGRVTGGAGSTTGGLVALNTFNYSLPTSLGSYLDPSGTATNSYWDTQSTGQSNSAGGTGQTTAQLASGLPVGFDPALWAIMVGQTYPYLIDPAPSPLPIANPPSPPAPSPPAPSPPSPPPTPPTPPFFILPVETPLYSIQQVADYWRDVSATPAAIPAALVTPPAPVQASPRRQTGPGNTPQVTPPRESGVPPPGETRFIQDQVVFRICGVPESRVQTIARGIGLVSIGSQSLGLVGCTIYQYRIADGQSVRDKIRKLERLRIVASAQPNYVFALAQVPPAPAPTPPASEGDPAQYLVAKLRLPEVHRLARGNNVRVAVIDSEIDVNHPDLEGVIAERFDATGATEKPHPHGTGMAGAIASHKRLIGIAPGVRMLAVHAFGAATTGGQGTTMQIVKGLDWAVKQNARIVNMSFAGPKDPLLTQAVKATHDKGIVLIAAAGNAGPDSPPLYPGADPNVIAVTATDEDDHSYTGANRGKYVAVAAPGVDVLVPAPDGSYQLTTGTSVAAAEVSGVAALLLEKDPKLTPDEIRSILTSTAKTLGTAKRDDEFGYGLVDPYKALTSVNPRASSLEPAPVPAPITAAAR